MEALERQSVKRKGGRDGLGRQYGGIGVKKAVQGIGHPDVGQRKSAMKDRKGSGKAKKHWRPQKQSVMAGSQKEGKGFSLWRKQKIQLEYKKLLRKQKKASTVNEDRYKDNYPEHLKHLYLAEEEMLKKQEKSKKQRANVNPEVLEEEPVVVSRRKLKKKTSNQKAKEEYEKVQLERARKRAEAEKRRKQREEAQELYRKRKMESYKVLSTKTKKGQPNFNVQMEYLLQKIQKKS
ncbi:hypothetical protein XENTR_v10008463 [Xenopus tropicalis]|uniref:LOC100135227 protein n=1 Tax=Xenopus tropicalis TaxID=8364 RepID=A9ULP3_XENTR|nr:thyroid transcription factor 1-associated protein 26 [Xenopus tropicalis]AAI57337.1 LOC100135227 protein [Xenopus tropicalis]AAI71280.1 hypothetical protein LOC100135227 [Xenopus tropicalis]AAI71282.1 hypothetical protein LOC100135227 [Xenopus tropicalis]KAE8615276.1 hypothetical protein XENTR_v10008463 [Xenopus tropicalis]|eukprot:NP_001107396.1 thyroid transcription factor 1-associated protein 26 [Xenopus tropicalis]